ncbi:MAG: hypothetical protein LUE97_06295 [Oscillospiraceae bacterium]|nr:hypothetical protein [Oscillospiraceae bacterium]
MILIEASAMTKHNDNTVSRFYYIMYEIDGATFYSLGNFCNTAQPVTYSAALLVFKSVFPDTDIKGIGCLTYEQYRQLREMFMTCFRLSSITNVSYPEKLSPPVVTTIAV